MNRSKEKRRMGRTLAPVLLSQEHTEDVMDNRPPRSKSGSTRSSQGDFLPEDSDPSLDSSVLDEATSSASEDDSTEELGSTRVMDNPEQAAAEDSVHVHENALRAGKSDDLSALSDFELIKKLGQGAMGAVYQARQRSFDNRVVALKVLFPHVASIPKLVERLQREGLAMNRVDHPNIVHAYGIGQQDGWHYVVMEYVDGQSLQTWLEKFGKVSVADAVHIALACARGLEHAHAEKLVHRDIKPDNVLITRQGEVKVADLGMVKTLEDEEMGLTQTGHAVGTPWYMPLEQARNAKDVDGRCDIYALGCMLYCMITGNPPFCGRTLVEVIQAKEQGTFPPARRVNPDVPEKLDLIIFKMTAKYAKDRYQSCSEVIRDLEGLGLASRKLTFLQSKPRTAVQGPVAQPTMVTSLETTEDVWYLRVHKPDGSAGVRKLTTGQLKKMLEEGTVDPTAKASRQPGAGYAALATFKEFQATALAKQTKKAADKQSVRFRNLYKKAEEQDRKREERAEREEQKAAPAYYSGLIKPALIVGGAVVGIMIFFYMLFQIFK